MQFLDAATLHTRQGSHMLHLRVAKGLWGRFRGLMMSAPLLAAPQPQALFISRCPSVHGFFMRYAIDVVYLATESINRYSITHTTTLKPWRISFGKNYRDMTATGQPTKRSAHVLELPAGSIAHMGLTPSDTLEIHP